MGASTTTYRKTNNRIHEKLFDDAYSDTDQLVPMINLGMKNFYQTFWSFFNRKTVKRHMMSYNFLGDPSFIRNGIGCIDNITFNNEEIFHDGDEITYQASNTIETNNTFDVQTGSSVTLVAGESIVLKPGFHAGEGSNFHAYIAPCEDKVEKNTQTDIILPENNQNHGDTIHDQSIEKEASVFPNPFTNYILLNYYQQTAGDVNILIFDITGNKVYEEKVTENKGIIYHNINTSNFQAGTYIYNINTESILFKGTIIKIN